MPDLLRIKQNVSKMVNAGAPEQEIDDYISMEGTTVNAIKNIQINPQFTKISESPDVQRMAYLLRTMPFYRRGASLMSGKSLEEIDRILNAIPEPEQNLGNALFKALPDIAMASPVLKGAGAIPKIWPVAKTALGLGAYGGARMAGQNQPILPAAAQSAAFGTLGHGLGRVATTVLPKIPLRGNVGSALGWGATGAAFSPEDRLQGAAFGAGMGALSQSKPLQRPYFNQIAGRINNSLLKSPDLNKALLYGDPGMGIAREGLSGRTLLELNKNVKARLEELNQMADRAYSTQRTKLANYTTVFKPLFELRTKLMEHPLDNQAAITRLNNILQDVSGISTGKQRNFSNLNPIEARRLKQEVDTFTDWLAVGKGDHEVNIALKKTYHNIDAVLDSKIPQLKQLNSRIKDLISSEKAIEVNIRKGKTRDIIPESWWELANVPFRSVKSTAFKTNLARALAERYPKDIDLMPSPPLKSIPTQSDVRLPYQTRALPPPSRYRPTGYPGGAPPQRPLITPYQGSGPVIQGQAPYRGTTLPAIVPQPSTPRQPLNLEQLRKSLKRKTQGQPLRGAHEVSPKEIIELPGRPSGKPIKLQLGANVGQKIKAPPGKSPILPKTTFEQPEKRQWWKGRDWENELKSQPIEPFERHRDFLKEGYVPITREDADMLEGKKLGLFIVHVDVRGTETTGGEGYFMRPEIKGLEIPKEAKKLYENFKQRYEQGAKEKISEVQITGREVIGEKRLLPKSIQIRKPEGEAELLAEARKYRSAEQFVAARPTFYHGTKKGFDSQDIKIGEGNLREGIYLSNSKNASRQYGDKVHEYKIDPESKTLNLSTGEETLDFIIKKKILKKENIDIDLENYILSGKIFQYDPFNRQGLVDKILSAAKKEGYDAVDLFDDLGGGSNNVAKVIINKNIMKTPSQLTSLWQKAHGQRQNPLRNKSGQAFIGGGQEDTPYNLNFNNLDKKIPENYDNLVIPAIEKVTRNIKSDILKNKIYNYIVYYFNKGNREGILDSINIQSPEGVKKVAYKISANNIDVILVPENTETSNLAVLWHKTGKLFGSTGMLGPTAATGVGLAAALRAAAAKAESERRKNLNRR